MASSMGHSSVVDIDPGLPVPNPTTSFWQNPLHPLASVASKEIPASSDVVIIGSGISGCSVAKALLEGNDKLTITVLEARGLASGASSRNGGHIVSPAFQYFPELIKAYGVKTAVEVAEFTIQNIERTFEAVEQFAATDLAVQSKIRRTEKVLIFKDQETFEYHQKILETWKREMPGKPPFACLASFPWIAHR
jgi:glycine/D-amino acid oxidase-like deaminating enzyme